jgi:hypothetical protein
VVREANSDLGFGWIDIIDRPSIGAPNGLLVDDPKSCLTGQHLVAVSSGKAGGLTLVVVMIVGIGLLYLAAVRLGARLSDRST